MTTPKRDVSCYRWASLMKISASNVVHVTTRIVRNPINDLDPCTFVVVTVFTRLRSNVVMGVVHTKQETYLDKKKKKNSLK